MFEILEGNVLKGPVTLTKPVFYVYGESRHCYFTFDGTYVQYLGLSVRLLPAFKVTSL